METAPLGVWTKPSTAELFDTPVNRSGLSALFRLHLLCTASLHARLRNY
jgi:hypothetical protein